MKNPVLCHRTDSDRTVCKVNFKRIDSGAIGTDPIHRRLGTGEQDAVKE
ncbi:MAG: hypothetical protein P8X68_17555 [Desulfobacterales bacterium]